MIHILKWEVIHGEKLGRKLWYRTANIKYLSNDIDNSVFHINIVLRGKIMKWMWSYMVSKWVFEAHIFDFSEDIYGETLEVILLKKIRDNKKFDSLEVLKQQLARDQEVVLKEQLTTLTFWSFDIVHEWHRHYLNEAKKYGNHLIVILATDRNIERIKWKPSHNSIKRRIQEVEALAIVDEVIPGSESDPMMWLHQFRPFSICLWYDQRGNFVDVLPQKLTELWLETEIIRIDAFHPEKYKSSLLKKL